MSSLPTEELSEEEAIRILETELPDAGDYIAAAEDEHLDTVPSIDQLAPTADYQDWADEDTEIITCTIDGAPYKGRPFATVAQARSTVKAERGRILKEDHVPGRSFFRVMKVTRE